MHWFTRAYWRYLLVGCRGWRHLLCRYREHPPGPEWYTSNPEATEPDYRCRGCGDYLG